MDKTIEPVLDGSGDYAAYQHDTYPTDSVLHGQPRRTYLEGGTLEELKEDYPDAKVLDHSTRVEHTMSEVPPTWFDPAYAGEEW